MVSVRSLVLAFVLAGCSRGEAGPARGRPAPQVVVASVTAQDVPVEVQAPVDLHPLEQADVGSKVLGYIDAVFVDRGDRVKKGQVVALVRPSDLPDQLAAAKSGFAQTESSAELARTNLDRAQKLAPAGVVSQQELQQATAALASAEAAEATMKSQIAAIAVRLGETRIEAPIDGLVTVRRLDPGALVGPPGGGAIVTVSRVDRLRVFITINEHDATNVTLGKSAHVELDAMPGKTYWGKVVRIAPAFDPITRTIEAEIQLPNDAGELRPGMYGRGAIVVEVHPSTPVVSVNAVQISAGKRYAFVLSGDKVAKRPIETWAEVADGDLIEIRSGLSVGDEVVVAGADALSDGTVVRAVRDVNAYTGKKAEGPSTTPSPSKHD
jgi:RND family efflux transporter MFP subunit